MAYIAATPPALGAAAELLAFTADGFTQVVFGNAGQELEEIAMTRPHKIIAPPETVRRLIQSIPAGEPSRARRWIAKSPLLAKRLRLERNPWELPAALGRARWISTGPSLEFAARARARRFVTLEIDDSLV